MLLTFYKWHLLQDSQGRDKGTHTGTGTGMCTGTSRGRDRGKGIEEEEDFV